MSPRQLWILFGILILAAFPYLGDLEGALRVIIAFVLVILGILEFVARLPARGMVWFFRLLSLALASILLIPIQDSRDLGLAGCMISLSLPFLALAFAPTLPYRVRGIFYTAATFVGGFCGIVLALASQSTFLLIMNCLLSSVLWAACKEWKKLPERYAFESCLAWRAGARRQLARYKMPMTIVRGSLKPRVDLGFEFLLSLPLIQTSEALEKICRKFPHHASAWRLRTYLCFEREDFTSAAETLFEARQFGFESSSFDRALAYALYRLGNGMWREILYQGWDKAQVEAPWANEAEYLALRDPRDFWRSEDAMVERLAPRVKEMAAVPMAVPSR